MHILHLNDLAQTNSAFDDRERRYLSEADLPSGRSISA